MECGIVDGTSEDEHELASRLGLLESNFDHKSLPYFKTKLSNILQLRVAKQLIQLKISLYLAN